MIICADEEMLIYLHQHAFRAPLTYELFKLINVADIIGLVETRYETLDWKRIRRSFPLLCNAPPLVDHIAPCDARVVSSWLRPESRLAPRSVVGWPHRRLKELKAEGCRLTGILARTFLPSKWWVMLYYGATNSVQLAFCLLCTTYTLVNTGADSLDWMASAAQNWLDVLPASRFGPRAAAHSVMRRVASCPVVAGMRPRRM